MRVLLDTHILLWTLADDPLLPSTARKLIEDETNVVSYSSAAVWEVAIKHALHPDRMKINAAALVGYCNDSGFETLPIANRHVLALETLTRAKGEPAHNDPFDRIMLAQAKADKLMFVTHDALISGYGEACVLSV